HRARLARDLFPVLVAERELGDHEVGPGDGPVVRDLFDLHLRLETPLHRPLDVAVVEAADRVADLETGVVLHFDRGFHLDRDRERERLAATQLALLLDRRLARDLEIADRLLPALADQALRHLALHRLREPLLEDVPRDLSGTESRDPRAASEVRVGAVELGSDLRAV